MKVNPQIYSGGLIMFHAELVSLSDGQSYKDVDVCQDHDLDRLGIPKHFEEWTGCIFSQGQCLLIHHWKFKVIHLSHMRHSGPKSIHYERLILDGDIIYAPVTIIHQDNWANMGIPEFFVKRDTVLGQFAFSSPQGTFITHDINVTSLVIPDPRRQGVTRADNPSSTPFKIQKQNAIPDTIHGRITRRNRS
jgi:hypothetical protein